MDEIQNIKIVWIVFFPGITILDAHGPAQLFSISSKDPNSIHPLYKIISLGWTKEPIRTGEGLEVSISTTFDEVLQNNLTCDILLIPGGPGTRSLVLDRLFLSTLYQLTQKSSIIASVCTGAAFLAKLGLLDGITATTNKLAFHWVTGLNSKVKWVEQARWVSHLSSDGKKGIITSSGVSAGMDMTLHIIEAQFGKAVAKEAADRIEYVWHQNPNHDPFAHRIPVCFLKIKRKI